jgi:proline racemase
VPCFADRLDAHIEVEGIGTLRVDTAYGGDTFVIVDAELAGFEITPDEARDICIAGTKITTAANEQLGFKHPQNPDIQQISFCQFAKPIVTESGQNVGKNAVVVRPGKVDRSPTGTGVSARLAVLHAKGLAKVGYTLLARSIIDSEFTGRIEEEVSIDETTAIRPSISGRAWITGKYQLTLDPGDPYPEGYRLSDTWPKLS